MTVNIDKETKGIFLHAAILLAATAPFWIFDLDIKMQSLLYDFSSKAWKFAGLLPVKLLYDFGVYPAIIMTAVAAVVFGLGFAVKNMERHRKITLLIMLALFIGPAVTINVVLKNYSGRPRPRDIKEFNGKMDFKNVFELGTPGRGHSFPSGHASMGFLFTALYFAFKKKNKPAAYTALFGGIIYGSALGAVRMAQGGHFMSDVIWAFGITFISAELIWHKVLGGDGKSRFDSIKSGKPSAKISAAVIAGLLAALVIIFLFSVPYATDRYFKAKPDKGILELELDVEGDVRIMEQDSQDFIVLKANGFGFPRRHFSGKLEYSKTEAGGKYEFRTVKGGFFAELNSTVEVYLPHAAEYIIKVSSKKGDIGCVLSGGAPYVSLNALNGDVEFKAGGVIKDVYIKSAKGGAEAVFDSDTKILPGAFIDIKVRDELNLTNRSALFRELNDGEKQISGSKELYYKSVKKDGPGMNIKAGKIIVK